MDKLKPCPFCGRDVYIVEEGDYVEIACDTCGIAMSRDSYNELTVSWNTRTSSKPKIEPYLPCRCGKKRASTYFVYDKKAGERYIRKCDRCGLRVAGKTQKEIRTNWNKEVKAHG